MQSEDKIKEIRSANDIVDVISSYIPLTKRGKNFFGVCPFHDDTNPSMSVSKDKQIYKCFSCGASGNVFNFVMDYERVDFKEALSILAKRSGIVLNNMYVKNTSKFEKFYKIYDFALKFYQNNLNTTMGKEAKAYLNNRSINDDLIKTFKIGLSLNDNKALTSFLIKKEFDLKELEQIGLVSDKKDLYINRIMFPLFNTNGDVVGFSGRIYNTNSQSKYINTKETIIFKKGELLYNYHLAKEEARKAKCLILVEGFMDVIRLYSIGIKNVVALMGTSLTKEQVTLIKRVSNNIIINLDGDNPGIKACYSVGKELEKEMLNISVISMKNGLDPDEFILKYGEKEYRSLLDNPISFSDFKINYLKEGKNLANIEDQSKYINNVIEELKLENDVIKQELTLKKISLEFNIDIDILRKKLQKDDKSSKIETFKKQEETKEKLDKYKKTTFIILYNMLYNKDIAKLYEKKLNYLPYPEARYLANEIVYYMNKESDFVLADFITTLNDKKQLQDLVNNIMQEVQEEIDIDDANEYFKVIKEYGSSQEIKRLKELMKNETDPLKKAVLAEKIRLVKIGS